MRWTRLALAATVILAGLTMIASPASACSCAGPPFEPDGFGWNGIDEFDGVFIGTATDRRPVGQQQVVWTFEIDSVVAEKTPGELMTPIEVVTPEEGGACGLDTVSIGDQRAIGVSWDDGDWRSGLCSQDEVAALDGLGDRREPGSSAPPADDAGLSTGSGWGLTLVGAGFGAVVGAAVMAVVLARRRSSEQPAG